MKEEIEKIFERFSEKEKQAALYLHKELNNMEYTDDIDKRLVFLAKENGLVIIYPASDDLIIFEGSITDEYDYFDEAHIRFDEKGGILVSECDDENCPYFIKKMESRPVLVSLEYDRKGFFIDCELGLSFNMKEDGEIIGRGVIVPQRLLSRDSLEDEVEEDED